MDLLPVELLHKIFWRHQLDTKNKALSPRFICKRVSEIIKNSKIKNLNTYGRMDVIALNAMLVSKLPANITHLSFTVSSRKRLVLPETLTHLHILSCIEGIVSFDFVLPNLIWLYVGSEIEFKNIGNQFPILKHLTTYGIIDINTLPDSVEYIYLASNINEINRLPSSLKYLYLNSYSKPIESLPETLEYLYAQSVNISSLSSSSNFDNLTDLSLDARFSHSPFDLSILNMLPSNLINLEILTVTIVGSCSLVYSKIKKLTITCNNLIGTITEFPPELQNFSLSTQTIVNYCIDNLPDSLIALHFGDYYNHPLINIPKNLKHLKIGTLFNQPLDDLPDSVSTIIFTNYNTKFNQTIHKLPKSLKSLIFVNRFNQPLDVVEWPLNLKVLGLGSEFNHNIDILPDTIERLYLGSNFDQQINKLPANLKYLELSDYYNKPLPDSNLLELDGITYCTQLINTLPDSLQILRLPRGAETAGKLQLPKNLTKLYSFDNSQITIIANDSLKYMGIDDLKQFCPSKILTCLTTLLTNDEFNQPIDVLRTLTPNLKTLLLGHAFNHSIDNLPEHLEHLYLGCDFNKPITNLPKTLKTLCMSFNFNNTIENLPALTEMEIGLLFNYPIDSIPDTVEILGVVDWESIVDIKLPKALKKLSIGNFDDNYYKLRLLLNDIDGSVQVKFSQICGYCQRLNCICYLW